MSRTKQTFVLVFVMMLIIFKASAAVASDVLTNAAEIHSLIADEADRAIPVSITGIVTAAESDWSGRFIVQDESGGVYVDDTDLPHPMPGDLVHVNGVSNRGGFKPVIVSAHWKKLAKVHLPEAKSVSVQQLLSGSEDCERIEISGVVTSARLEGASVVLELKSGSNYFSAYPHFIKYIDPQSLVGATVDVKGTAAVDFAAQTNRLPIFSIFMPWSTDLISDRPMRETRLTTAAQALSLKYFQAIEKVPISVTGIVTVAESCWHGKFVVQDSTGGVFVDNTNNPQPSIGDVVQVTGVSDSGDFAPDIIKPHWNKLGTSPLPEVKPVTVEQFMSGAEDGWRIELWGVVRSVQSSPPTNGLVALEIKSDGYRYRAYVNLSGNVAPKSLVGAAVHVKGTATASSKFRHMFTVCIYAPQVSDFGIDQPPDLTVSQEPFTSLTHIAQYHRHEYPTYRIHVKGVVIYQRPGEDIFLHDHSGGLQVKCSETNIFAPGQVIEAVGFPGMEGFLPILEDATLIPTRQLEKTVDPLKASIQDLFLGLDYADLVSVQGELLDRSFRSRVTANSLTNTEEEIFLTLKSDKYYFNIEVPAAGQYAGLAEIPMGSKLDVSGISLQQAGQEGEIQTVQIVPIDASGIRILQKPSWWTPQRLLIALGTLIAISCAGIIWTITILRKNSALEISVTEKTEAQQQLEKAKDLLEWRVAERTKQLKVEMSARQEYEVQYKAVLRERTRLAQELHDTLLQGFTGIGLKLDVFARSLPASLSDSKKELEHILDQSDQYLTEARRTVWELRSPTLENNQDLSKALMHACNSSLQGTGIHLNFSVDGVARTLPPVVEDNLLRICQEAVTNAVKHAAAKQTDVHLTFAVNEVKLRIQDDGCGFNPEGPETSKAGHFGLVGMRERVKSLDGSLSVNSQPGKGTEVIVTIQT